MLVITSLRSQNGTTRNGKKDARLRSTMRTRASGRNGKGDVRPEEAADSDVSVRASITSVSELSVRSLLCQASARPGEGARGLA